MLAALAEGTSVIRNWLPAGDTLATLEVIRALGVPVEVAQRNPDSWELRIEGRGLHGLRKPNVPLDCRNAGTGIRLLTGIMSGQSFSSILDGSEQLRKRPMGRVTEPLQRMGADIKSADRPRSTSHTTGRVARHRILNECRQRPGEERYPAGRAVHR